MTIQFTKMHGLGNDFIVIDGISQTIDLKPNHIKALSQRDIGIGFDQCLLVEKSLDKDIDFFYRIFNADGQEVGQCGNGARCLARFLYHYQLTTKRIIRVKTRTTLMTLQIHEDNTVTVNMGKPLLAPKDIPIIAEKIANYYPISLKNHTTINVHAISIGNPHATIFVKELNTINVSEIGQEISNHSNFPEQTNVGFIELINSNHILLRVYERGCGETRACGSGAVAAVACGRLYHGLKEKVTVSLPGGDLIVTWPNLQEAIYLNGPATFIYEGRLMENLCAS